jgi:two-component system, NtrC family, response regulator AtoC
LALPEKYWQLLGAASYPIMTTDRFGGLMVQEDPSWIAGMSPAVQTLENVIAEIAPTNIPILLVGESGTGKEMFANRVHRLSQNADEPLTRISCASVDPEKLALELGLNARDGGNVQNSGSGTVFLDEIAELNDACQRALLCALPDGEVGTRRGLTKARVISTTSRNLDEEMRAGRFRSELYYRINGVCLRLPPLRDRKEDIPVLAQFFLTKHAAQFNRTRLSLSPKAIEILLNYSWPGNIRELENVAKKILALGDELLAIAELGVPTPEPGKIQTNPATNYSLKVAARAASREAERELIIKALTRTRWNRKRAARDLQISYKSLLYKLKQIGFDEPEAV